MYKIFMIVGIVVLAFVDEHKGKEAAIRRHGLLLDPSGTS